MQKLNREMLERYEIEPRAEKPGRIAQFGSGTRLLTIADRLLEDSDLDIVCVPTEHADYLREQEGLFTLIVRGYEGDKAIDEEKVVQCVREIADDLSDREGIDLALTDLNDPAPMTQYLRGRYEKGAKGLKWICLCESPEAPERFAEALGAADGAFVEWLRTENTFYPALADGLAYRATAKEAAAICAKMNYKDAMLHLAEPYAKLTVGAPKLFEAENVVFTEDIAAAMSEKSRIFDAGLFLMTAVGYLAGFNTLHDCMKDETVRDYVGHAFTDEIMPSLPKDSAAAIISAFDRYENAQTEHRLTEAGTDLLGKFRRGILPVIRSWSEERFEVPPRLTYALSATIMLLAGARKDSDGAWTVARGDATHPITENEAALEAFSLLAHDMPPESLAYAALADRTLWDGEDLREIDGLEARVALNLAALQRGE